MKSGVSKISFSHAPAAGRRRRIEIVATATLIILFLAFFHWPTVTDKQIQNVQSLLGTQPVQQSAEATEVPHIEYVEEAKEETEEEPTGTSKEPAVETPVGAVIAAAQATTNVTWMDELQKDRWKPYAYNVDDPSPPAHLAIPANKGHEAMVYLSWIIDHYDGQLPAYAVFTHGHAASWHQEGDMGWLLANMRLDAVRDAGYVSLRCDWYPSCPQEIRPKDHDAVVWGPGVNREATEYAIAAAWGALFPNETLPATIASQCCAQFAVSREAIRSRRKEEYVRMRQWILNSTLPDDVSGRVLEKLWAYIFTRNAVNCPAPQRCACEFFGQCDAKTWSKPPKGLPEVPWW